MSGAGMSGAGMSGVDVSGRPPMTPGERERATLPSPRAVWTVAKLDLTQRVRASRTAWTIGLWVLFVYGFVTLGWLATSEVGTQQRAALFYGITVAVVLALTLLIAPSLSASSITGDREHGVLATLQTTLLTPAEIALGKLLAAWLATLGFLGLTVPVLLWALFAGGVSVGSLAAAVATIALALLAVSAIGLAVSALSARTVSSVVLTYVVTGFLVLGMPLLFALTLPMVTGEELVRVRTYAFTSSTPLEPPPQTSPATSSPPSPATSSPPSPGDNPSADATPRPADELPDGDAWPVPSERGVPQCREVTALRNVTHTERTWWLLAPNPFVVVADIAPEQAHDPDGRQVTWGALRSLGDAARSARNGPPAVIDECWGYGEYLSEGEERRGLYGVPLGGPIWPIGFVTYGLLAVGGTLIAIRRLRAPARLLPRGIRIA